MNYCYNFDINVYNSFLYYSGGYTPTYQQYQHFANYLYNYQIAQGQLQITQGQLQMPQGQLQIPQGQLQMAQGQLQNYITNQTQLSSQQEQQQTEPLPQLKPIQKFSFCIKGMGCKDIKCNDYHHPSKDLDILNASKK